jgi:hypothetical protein
VTTERERRIAKNEALFRAVNERIKEIRDKTERPDEDFAQFVCECGREECVAEVALTLHEYERVRLDPTHFVVLPGHETAVVEWVLAENERYAVVRKHPEEASIARETNPRT